MAITASPEKTSAQTADLRATGFGALLWGGEALDGRQLAAGADAVVSAGGSMNREAAVLGAPAYSIYAGKPAVAPPQIGDELVVQFVDRLLALARRRATHWRLRSEPRCQHNVNPPHLASPVVPGYPAVACAPQCSTKTTLHGTGGASPP